MRRLGRRFYRLDRRSRSGPAAPALSADVRASANTADTTTADTAPAAAITTPTTTADPVKADAADTAASLPEQLWDRAYDGLKVKEKALVQAYEKILSCALRGHGVVSPEDESEQNDIEQKNVHARRNQMYQLICAGLDKIARQARAKENLDEGMKLVLTLKDMISTGLQVAPQAALPWAGVCVALQVSQPANRSFFSHADCIR